MSIYKNVAVIGTGVVGTGWVIRCLASTNFNAS